MSTTTSSTSDYRITGRPVMGDITQGDVNMTPQITNEEFLALVDAVLDLPHVVALKWMQYTPYFNDGEPCTFGIYDARIVFDFGLEDGGDWDDGSYGVFDLFEYTSRDYRDRKFEVEGHDTTEHYKALEAFDNSDRWERVAQLNFGDHAEVTATKAGFDVEYYEHD